MSERAVPFHCPYCGEQDLWPFETPRSSAPQEPPFETPRSSAPQEPPSADSHGAWECRGCLRAFSVKMLGMVRPEAVGR